MVLLDCFACRFKQILKVVLYSLSFVRPLTSYLTNHPSKANKTYWTLLRNKEKCKRCFLVNSWIWILPCWLTSKNLDWLALRGHWVSLWGLTENDEPWEWIYIYIYIERERERKRESEREENLCCLYALMMMMMMMMIYAEYIYIYIYRHICLIFHSFFFSLWKTTRIHCTNEVLQWQTLIQTKTSNKVRSRRGKERRGLSEIFLTCR